MDCLLVIKMLVDMFYNFGMREVSSRWSQFVYDEIKEHSYSSLVLMGNVCILFLLCTLYSFISPTCCGEILLFLLTFVLPF